MTKRVCRRYRNVTKKQIEDLKRVLEKWLEDQGKTFPQGNQFEISHKGYDIQATYDESLQTLTIRARYNPWTHLGIPPWSELQKIIPNPYEEC